jgi:hypothetical protein
MEFNDTDNPLNDSIRQRIATDIKTTITLNDKPVDPLYKVVDNTLIDVGNVLSSYIELPQTSLKDSVYILTLFAVGSAIAYAILRLGDKI